MTSTKQRRGRKPYDETKFAFPENEEFRVKSLALQSEVSIPFIHQRMAALGDKIKRVRDYKVDGQKGRVAGMYIYTP